MQRDYIMRLIEQAVAFLVGTMLKGERGKMVEAGDDLNQFCEQTAGIDLATLKNMSPEAIEELLGQGGALRYTRSVILAEILLTDAALQERDPAAPFPLKNLVHAFCLLSDSIHVLGNDDEKIYRAKLQAIAARLQPYRGHPALKARFDRLALLKNGDINHEVEKPGVSSTDYTD